MKIFLNHKIKAVPNSDDHLLVCIPSGNYKADTVIGVAMLRLAFSSVDVVCSLAEETFKDVLESGGILLGVGGKYNPLEGYYDFFSEEAVTFKGALNSAGLILKELEDCPIPKEFKELVKSINKSDNKIKEVISLSNPIPFAAGEAGRRFYEISGVMSDLLLKLCLGEINIDELVYSFEEWLQQYTVPNFETVQLAQNRLSEIIKNTKNNILLLEQVEPALRSFSKDTPEGINFCVHPMYNGAWTATALDVSQENTQARKLFPETWAGLLSDELCSVTGFDGCILCTEDRRSVVHADKEGALKLAELAMEL